MLKNTNTREGLEFQSCGVTVEEEMGLLSKDEAYDLQRRINAKLVMIAE